MVPVPSSLSTSMLPPLAPTNFLHIDNPNPCPCAFVAKKGSKIFGILFSGIPTHVSSTVRMTCSSVELIATVRLPPLGIA